MNCTTAWVNKTLPGFEESIENLFLEFLVVSHSFSPFISVRDTDFRTHVNTAIKNKLEMLAWEYEGALFSSLAQFSDTYRVSHFHQSYAEN